MTVTSSSAVPIALPGPHANLGLPESAKIWT
jgi:hypothetical protein